MDAARIRAFVAFGLACLAVAARGAHAGPASLPPCTVRGTAGDDLLVATRPHDVVCGFGGNDTIVGGPGPDVLIGGPGNDKIEGGPGVDTMIGGPGNDVFFSWFDRRRDIIDGGPGRDRAFADTADRVRGVEVRTN